VSTLHAGSVISSYASDCRLIRTMWGAWTPAVREQGFRRVYQSLCQRAKIPVPNLVFKNYSSLGAFSWGSWSITVDNKPFKKALSKDEFIDLCCTVYHETRHSEQFFRVAQGLLLKRFDFPGKLPQGSNLKAQVGSALNIPPAIVGQADSSKGGYSLFATSAKLPHCTTGSGPGWSNWDPTVSDWLERTYSKSKQRFAEQGQAAPSGTAIDRAWYRGAEDERDAYAVEDLVKAALRPVIS
jgi:hypothetical protein